MRIFKYVLKSVETSQTFEIPGGDPLRVVHVGRDPKGDIAFWVEVNEQRPVVTREIVIVGTGWEIPAGLVHIGSFVDGAFVWHLYKRPTDSEIGSLLGF